MYDPSDHSGDRGIESFLSFRRLYYRDHIARSHMVSDLVYRSEDPFVLRVHHAFLRITADISRDARIRQCASLRDHPAEVVASHRLYHVVSIHSRCESWSERDRERRHIYRRPCVSLCDDAVDYDLRFHDPDVPATRVFHHGHISIFYYFLCFCGIRSQSRRHSLDSLTSPVHRFTCRHMSAYRRRFICLQRHHYEARAPQPVYHRRRQITSASNYYQIIHPDYSFQYSAGRRPTSRSHSCGVSYIYHQRLTSGHTPAPLRTYGLSHSPPGFMHVSTARTPRASVILHKVLPVSSLSSSSHLLYTAKNLRPSASFLMQSARVIRSAISSHVSR